MKNLATIQQIKSIRPHTNSDNLELAEVLGWQVVVKKNEFKVDDLCVYICTDTVLPEKPEFEFLRNKHFRIKPIRLRGQSSNGICFPLDILGEIARNVFEKQDVTDILNVIHYEKPVPAQLAGQAVGHIPGFIIITDEDNLRSYPNALTELRLESYYITRKDDGSSGTYFIKNGEFGVCSRRIHLKEDPNNGFWKMAHKYNIEAALQKHFGDVPVALQGEVVGPGVQSNPLGLKELELHIFNLFNIFERSYYSYNELNEFCEEYNIPTVTLVEEGFKFEYTLEQLIAIANELKYPNGKPAEGIVLRSKVPFFSEILNKTWSGKIINENYKDEN